MRGHRGTRIDRRPQLAQIAVGRHSPAIDVADKDDMTGFADWAGMDIHPVQPVKPLEHRFGASGRGDPGVGDRAQFERVHDENRFARGVRGDDGQ